MALLFDKIKEVDQMSQVLREKLLQTLREDLQLALSVRIVSYLRRLDALQDPSCVASVEYEKKLKEEFLACRNVWLASLSRGLSSSDPYQYVCSEFLDHVLFSINQSHLPFLSVLFVSIR